MLKIAVMGTRGIPAHYGGFETLAQELATRLSERGHQVTVYCRSHYVSRDLKEFKGVNLIVLPTIRHKYLDTVVHTFVSAFHSLFRGYEAVLIGNSVNAMAGLIPRLGRSRVIINVDGLDRKRKKWNWLGKCVYRISERASTLFPDAVVTDSRFIQSYYKQRYDKDSTYIAYGGDLPRPAGDDILKKLGLPKNHYLLLVGRLEPENNAHRVIEAFESVETDRQLVVLGDAPYAGKYIEKLRATGDNRIRFLGAIYGEGYRQILRNCYLNVRASEVGGIHPALVEALGYGRCNLVSDNPQNRETVGEAGLFFDLEQDNDLGRKMQYLIDKPHEVSRYGEKARERMERYFTWDKITQAYEQLYEEVCGKEK